MGQFNFEIIRTKTNMKMFAATLLLASAACGSPMFNNFNSGGLNQGGFNAFGGSGSFGSSLQPNSFSRQNAQFGQGGFSQGINADQRAIYLPVMRALLKVMDTNRPTPQDINTLMVATRELNRRVPDGGFGGLGGLGGNIGGFNFNDLKSMGLPETGDMIANVNGVPHIRTKFGIFPLSETSLMTQAERNQFLPIVRTFTNVLENGNANPNEINTLMQQTRTLTNLIPGNIGNSLMGLLNNNNLGGNNNFRQQNGFSGFSG